MLEKEFELKKKYLNTEIKCLDKGYVRLVDFMGSDSAIVQAARTSTGQGIKTPEEDRNLLRYLVRHFHHSPLEMVEFKFHVKLPIFVARQNIRHRQANVNEFSARYSEMPEECFVPEPERLKKQGKFNKQSSATEVVPLAEEFTKLLEQEQVQIFKNYNSMLENEVAREVARINLPVSTYTNWYWKMDLRNLFHMLNLRMDSHAQEEIQVYARAMYDLIKPIVPVACEAFEDYIFHARTFSQQEVAAIKAILDKKDLIKALKEVGLDKRERKEFFLKLGE